MSNSGYDERYVAWKHWDQGFAPLSENQEFYFQKELSNIDFLKRANMRVLEIGFGQGSFLGFCRQQGWQIAGVEANPDLVDRARQAGFEVSSRLDLEDFSQQSFDLIVAFDVLEHVETQAATVLIQKIAELLRSGGVFLARFPNGDSPLGLIHQNGDVTHVNFIGMGKIRYYALASGLQLVYAAADAPSHPETKFSRKLRNAIRMWLKRMISAIANWIYTPKMGCIYHSSNLVVALRKP